MVLVSAMSCNTKLLIPDKIYSKSFPENRWHTEFNGDIILIFSDQLVENVTKLGKNTENIVHLIFQKHFQ